MQKNLVNLSHEMVDNGYPAIQDFQIDGDYHRFAINGHKGQPGYYSIRKSASGLSAVYGDFVSRKQHLWTSENNSKALTPEEKEALKKQLAREAAELEAKIKRKHEQGATLANFSWSLGGEVTSHPYLKIKNVKSYGLRICATGYYSGRLMVPGYNADGELVTMQYIGPNGDKLFESGGEKKGAFFEIAGDVDKVIIAEGYSTSASNYEATGHTAIVAFDAGNLILVANIIREKHPDSEIIIAADNDQWKPEVGNTGVKAAMAAAVEIDAKLVIPQFKNTDTRPTDFNDLANLEGLDAVRAQIEVAAPVKPIEALKIEIKKLLDLDPLEQEAERSRLAKKYDVRKRAIDQYIGIQTRVETVSNAVVNETEPAADPVDGGNLLNGILADIKQRVILPDGAAEAITLWILLTYCHTAFNVLPLLGIVSPTKRCGKTTLIEILQGLTNKGLAASNLTPAAAFRTIDKYSPTLLIDEADTFLKDNDELRGIINSGHTRTSAFVIRVEGDNYDPVKFSTWGPKAIGMIGSLPDTLKDRSIVINLARKMPGEKIVKTGLDFAENCMNTRSMCRRWADDNIATLKNSSVTVPPSGNDRADDNWYPLFAIANAIGGDWPEKFKKSMQQFVSVSDDDAINIKLLSDIRHIFEENSFIKIFSRDLVEQLNLLPESPWADWNRGKGLTTNAMSRQLKPFGVTSKSTRIGNETAKGYTFKKLQNVFTRYLPGDQNVTTSQVNAFNNLDEKQNVTQDMSVMLENSDNILNLNDCDGVAFQKQGTEPSEEKNEDFYDGKVF